MNVPSRTFCFVAATQIPLGGQLLFLTRILAITITLWIAFRESSHGVMPCSVVIISVLPRERVDNAFYPRRATKVVSRSIRKRPCCQQSVGCSKELLKIREIQPPRKSTSVAYLFDNVYNRNVRDIDNILSQSISVFVVAKYTPGSVMPM